MNFRKRASPNQRLQLTGNAREQNVSSVVRPSPGRPATKRSFVRRQEVNETPDEIKERIFTAMGEELGEVYHLLRNYLVDIHVTWIEYRTLFATNEKTVGLLNDLAPTFFARVQTIFWHELLISVCRLTDPPEMSGKQNLSVLRIPSLITDPGLRAQLEAELSRTIERTQFARDWRNRHLAHLDLGRARDPEAHPLQTATRQSVEDALSSLRDPMNLVETYFLESTTAYEHTITAPGDAESLVSSLGRAAVLKKRP